LKPIFHFEKRRELYVAKYKEVIEEFVDGDCQHVARFKSEPTLIVRDEYSSKSARQKLLELLATKGLSGSERDYRYHELT